MSSQLPITLEGANLGERHHHLNSLVIEAYNAGEPFKTIAALTETTPVDRLFKIDLASKHNNLEYILKSLQDDDMLYVSRALKSKWLVGDEYQHIINPTYLEDVLYPGMITTAITKMKHWIYLNMRDSERCQGFYEYYLEKDTDYAFKFLHNCSEDIIMKEFTKKVILDKITPHRFKILCEKTPSVAKIYFQLLQKDKPLLEKYAKNENKYFDSIKCILKIDGDTYLDIIEQHFLSHFKRLSKISTKYIMSHYKQRFRQKAELYAARILNLDTLAQCLTQDECEELTMRLARAQYLQSEERWFNYKNVEPLVKRLDVKKRSSFRKRVFVDKDIGTIETDCSYTFPTSLFDLFKKDPVDVFYDEKLSSDLEEDCMYADCLKLENRMENRMQLCCAYKSSAMPKTKTLLDSLFEEYRFKSFEKTLFELRKKIKSESSSQNRMYMMLVLVSKSGGKTESLKALFQLLMEHCNEPCQVRAAVIRSLVKRAFVWRISEEIWNVFLTFGRDLGLDGSTPEADCNEGLHAVVIRTLLSNLQCDPMIITAYIKKFSTLTCYSLTMAEKQHINKTLLNVLLESANAEAKANNAGIIISYALDTIRDYHVKFETCPEIIASIKNLIEKDQNVGNSILKRLFDSKLGRKSLFRENFDFIQTDASYLNALKHDVTIFSVEKIVKAVVSDQLNAEQFFHKIGIYFNQKDDLGSHFLTAFKEVKIHKKLARPLAYLIGDNLKSYILELDTTDAEVKRYSAVIRAHAHLARPAFSIDSIDWHKSGVKLIANRILKCRSVDIDHLIKRLLTWKSTARLAIVLSQRTNYEADVFAAVAKIRPTIALKTALEYFRQKGDNSDIRVWKIVRPLILKRKESIKANGHLLRNMKKIQSLPLSIRPDYTAEIFKVVIEIDFNQCTSVAMHIKDLVPNIDENFIEAILCDFIENRFPVITKSESKYHKNITALSFFNIFVKYLLLCKTEETQKKRFEKVGRLYLARLRSYWECKGIHFYYYFNEIVSSLKYNEAFFNEDYVSCLPVMENIVEWMKTILPIEKYFSSYVPLHLNMLYYKAVREAVKQMPDVFSDKQRRRNEGYKLVGESFGKYIGHEVKVLTQKYYDSIVMLYDKGLVEYIHFFNFDRFLLVPYIIKGIVEVAEGVEYASAVLLYNDNFHNLNYDQRKEVQKCLGEKNQNEMQFYFHNLVRRPIMYC